MEEREKTGETGRVSVGEERRSTGGEGRGGEGKSNQHHNQPRVIVNSLFFDKTTVVAELAIPLEKNGGGCG